jgi:hypothetical protein
MAFTGNYTCNSFKSGLINGDFDFASDTFKIALYTNDATLNADTSAYSSDNEVSASGYTAGGNSLTVTTGTTGGTSFVSFADSSWSAAITARGALIYKDGGAAVCVLDFGSDKTSTTTFTVDFPAASSTDALIRLS